jgi:hypothetical protein
MSDKIDQFCESMRLGLNTMEAKIEQAKADIAAAQKDGAENFDRKLGQARTAVETQRNLAEAAGIKVRHWVAAKAEAGDALIQDWKDKFDKSQLDIHASRAEASARASVTIAEAAIADAALATYEAIAARQHAARAAMS